MTRSTISRYITRMLSTLLIVVAGALAAGAPADAQVDTPTPTENSQTPPVTGSAESEDVPDLRRAEDLEGDVSVEPMGRPEIVVDWSPKPVIAGPDGFIVVSARPAKPDRRPMTYTFDSGAGPHSNKSGIALISRLSRPGWLEVTVTAQVDGGFESIPITVFIPVLSPDDNLLNNEINQKVDDLRSGYLRPEPVEITDFDITSRPTTVAAEPPPTGVSPAAQPILDSAAPWKDPLVQQCVQQYLDFIAFPVEDRLDPGKFTHIDNWGRLVGAHLQATGPVDGFWDNATHFVWSQYGSERATRRYGVSLRDYVADCLDGLAGRSPTEDAAGGDQAVRDILDNAQTQIDEGYERNARGDVAGALESYRKALEALLRAQRADTDGNFEDLLNDAIAAIRRNIDKLAELAPDDSAPEGAQPDTGGIGPGLVVGEDIRAAFETLRRRNIVAYSDLESVQTGLHGTLGLGATTLRMRTTEFRYPLPVRAAPDGTPVAVLPYNFVRSPANHRFMGVQAGHLPDGQSKYEFVLSPPASHVGLMRNWNSNALTRFYNAEGALLAEYRNQANRQFVGYVADRPDRYVARIEFDGVPSEPGSGSNMLYQVGEVDDLYIGSPGAQDRPPLSSDPISGIWRFPDDTEIKFSENGGVHSGQLHLPAAHLARYGFSQGETTYRGLKQVDPGVFEGETKMRNERGDAWWEPIRLELDGDTMTSRFGTSVRVR